ncbi:CD109 antigen-like isoform X15 [Dreissena polymorpha]|nr:CD109 antigen-like isoform X12 [Dreissena polymorpha]XP_052253502.1 CD109 antigen-like isoform X15 [Dreissena polymorpha]
MDLVKYFSNSSIKPPVFKSADTNWNIVHATDNNQMLKAFILAAALAVASAENSYVVLTPKSFRPGVPLNISVNVLKASGDVNVRAELFDDSTKAVIASAHKSVTPGSVTSIQINVPDNLHIGSYKIQVQGSGHGLHFQNETSINYEMKSISIFIQTDKANYKPGQTINFRAFAVFPNLTVYTGSYDIEIYDPNMNKIKQWLGLSDASGVVTNFLEMDTQPVIGDWKVKVTAHGRSTEKIFVVAHYVLPKFEVKVELASFILTSDNALNGKVSAIYTYGKPVQGTANLIVKYKNWYRPYNYHGDEPRVMQALTLSVDGTASFSIPLDAIKTINKYLDGRTLTVEANVTESLNHITLSGKNEVKIYDRAWKMEFLKSYPNTFKPGLSYTAYLRVSQQDDHPIQGVREDVRVTVTCFYQDKGEATTPYPWYEPPRHRYMLPEQTLTVPDNGIVPIQVDIPKNSTSVYVLAIYGKSQYDSDLELSKSYSPSDNYMQLSLKSSNLRAGQVAVFDVRSTETISNLFVQVMSRGNVVMAGTVSGSTFSIHIDSKMAPNARIIAYYVRADGEVVTDSISFDVDGAFQNQVSLSFDKTKAAPGDNVNVIVTADPQSIVNLLAVDQSVLLLRSGNDVTQSEVIDELKSYDTISHDSSSFCCDFMPTAMGGRRKRMVWWPYPRYFGGADAQTIFDNSGVKVLTDANVFHHNEPIILSPHYHGFIMGLPEVNSVGTATAGSSSPVPLQIPDRIRNVFPETWLWSNSSTGADGTVTISTTVPDTITSWIASAFAVHSKSGLGIASSPAKIEAFKPFFVSLNLPYSVIRGEELALQANVFNYMSQDLDVLVTLKGSSDFRSMTVDANGHVSYGTQTQTKTVHIPAGEAKSVFFPIVPASLGTIPLTVTAQSALAADGVQRQLLVEPEGVARYYSNPILVDLKNQTTFSQVVDISMPQTVVAGSQKIVVTAIGDLLGPTVNNLDKLLKMPTGCGEQTMLGFAPDVFVTNYLTATNQLTGDIKDKAISFMEKGYQRELTYQHKDGSFSAFGDRDPSGSMWLTAFVAKSFHQAKKQIFIDDDILTRAIEWMINRQKADGSFPEPGHVIDKYMQGGAASGVGLTAFVLASLFENNDLQGSIHQRITQSVALAKHYLESQITTTNDDYVLSLCNYALTLAKSPAVRDIQTKLKNDAIVSGGTIHWHKDQAASIQSHWQPAHSQANPIDIEMTAYNLLVTAEAGDISVGLQIIKWITAQRNSNGGFSSTQDTVVALQALSRFAAMIFSDTFNIQATVTAGTFTHTFNINKQNALVMQSVVLSSIPSQVSVSATGHGMALLDVGLSFNVEQEIETPSFQIDVTIVTETIDMLSVKSCVNWLKAGTSGMAIQEFGIPSGFEADLESIEEVVEIKRVETKDRKLVLYFNQITPTPLCLSLDIIRTGMVAKSQPAAIRVYDYYQPSNQVTSFYQSKSLQNAHVCDICAECGCKGNIVAIGG